MLFLVCYHDASHEYIMHTSLILYFDKYPYKLKTSFAIIAELAEYFLAEIIPSKTSFVSGAATVEP